MNSNHTNKKLNPYIIGIDVGGTNVNSGILGIKDKKIQLLFSLNFKTKNIDSIIDVINKILEESKKYNIKIDTACIAAAGVISKNKKYVKLTNASFDIKKEEIIKNTSLKNVFLINDFQALAYGIKFLNHKNKEEIFTIRKNKENNKKTYLTKTLIGAGTGFGKNILLYDKKLDKYISIPSEGGHTDFPIQNDFEKQLIDFIKKLRKIDKPVTYEEVLSGRGLEGIYKFLKNIKKFEETKYTKKIDNSEDMAQLISNYKDLDKTCKETFKLFFRFYARCAKNFVLDTLSIDGIYLGGGIVSKNKDILKTDDFIKEFENAYRRSEILKKTPIYIILEENASLYGACFVAYKNLKDVNKKDN